jgi:three prime repair exonuclease-1
MATIVPQVSDMTGLDNYNLNGQSKFNKSTGDLMNNFLSCLPSPVCLIAHNGNAYDFPLLKAELENAGVQLSPEIFCADSYVGIKEIFANRRNIFEREKTKNEESSQQKERKIAKIELDALADLVNSGVFEEEMSEGISDNGENLDCAFSSKQENEKTPCKIKDTVASCIKPRKANQNNYNEKSRSRKNLDFSAPTSFSLINLHLHLLGYRPLQSHGAEADCVALLKTTAALGKEWIDWVRENSCKFSNCKMMWGM